MAQVISEEQKLLNKKLHEENKNFGNRANAAGLGSNIPTALIRMHELNLCNSFLDYGCGKGRLVERLIEELPNTITVNGYDPAIEKYEIKPEDPVDILTCLDVLEHIEMENIDAVLTDIQKLTKHFCYLVIDLQPAVKKLADGRNAHILLAPQEWWVGRIAQIFKCQASFPVMHTKGLPQKLVIAATNNPRVVGAMYGFLIKMRLFNFAMGGGILGGKTMEEAKKAAQAKKESQLKEKESKTDEKESKTDEKESKTDEKESKTEEKQ